MKSLCTQLSPEIFDPRKVDPKFLEATFEYFILLSARDDENRLNRPVYFNFWPTKLLNFVRKLKKWNKN